MPRTYRTAITLFAAIVAGAVLSAADQGKNKPGPIAATAQFDCSAPNPSRGLCATGPIVAELSGSLNEMEIRDAAGAMILNFNGQRPEDSPDPVDCSVAMLTCLWDWSQDVHQNNFLGFALGTNILDPSGSVELSGGLRSMPLNVTHKVRLNMTVTMPQTAPEFWKFNFNASNPATGGGDDADVLRISNCTWVFSASTARASLAILTKPAKGKQVLQREGTYLMPFELTFTVPSIC